MTETVTSDEAKALLGPADDLTLAEVLDVGATRAELIEAWSWVENDEAMLNEGRPIPSGRVARLIEILKDREEEELPELPEP